MVPGRFFGAPWWRSPTRCSDAHNFRLAARVGSGRYLSPPNSGPRLLFRGVLVAPASTLLLGPQLRSGSKGRYLGPPNSDPRLLFRGALVASASALLRGPQFRIAWLSVTTEIIGVRRNKYWFCIVHIYVMKPITWQPSRIQTDGERQWAEKVLCFIGGPR